jgi:hypothetical protein
LSTDVAEPNEYVLPVDAPNSDFGLEVCRLTVDNDSAIAVFNKIKSAEKKKKSLKNESKLPRS